MQNNLPDLKPYQPFGIPILKLMGSFVLLSLAMVAVYELFF